jgi:DNA polymerase III subunit epsilon
MSRLLILSVAPGLAETNPMKTWVQGELRRRVAAMAKNDAIMVGEESDWAVQDIGAADSGVTRVVLSLLGTRMDNGRVVKDWCPAAEIDFTPPDQREQRRSEAMLEAGRRARSAGWDVGILVMRVADQRHEAADYLALTNTMAGVGALPIDEAAYRLEVAQPDVVWIDLETGGTAEHKNPIIEIGAVRATSSSRRVIDKFEIKLAVPRNMIVERDARIVNGYSEIQWQDAIEQSAGLADFLRWLPDRFVAGGYNFPFDKRFLIYSFAKYGLSPPGWIERLTIDPMQHLKNNKAMYPTLVNAKLDTVCEHFGITNSIRHRALADAERTRLVYLRLMRKEPENSIFQGA